MHRIPMAEDDLMIADRAEDVLVALGYKACGIARTLAHAATLGRHHRPDIAIIEVRMEMATAASKSPGNAPASTGSPILYVTGNASSIMTGARGHGGLLKPRRLADLLRSLEIVAGLNNTGKVAPRFSDGFRLLPGAMARPLESAHT